MSYVRETLAPGESIVMVAHFNWTYWAPSWFWFLLAVSPGVYALILQQQGTLPGDPVWIFGMCATLGILGTLSLLGHWIHVITTEIAVTNSRFVYKTGLISRHSNEVSLNKIEEISLTQSVLGRIFGYGSLVLRGTGVGVIVLPNIDNPIQFRRAIEGAKSGMRQTSDDRDFPSEAGPETALTAKQDAAPSHKPRKIKRSRRQTQVAPSIDLPEKLR